MLRYVSSQSFPFFFISLCVTQKVIRLHQMTWTNRQRVGGLAFGNKSNNSSWHLSNVWLLQASVQPKAFQGQNMFFFFLLFALVSNGSQNMFETKKKYWIHFVGSSYVPSHRQQLGVFVCTMNNSLLRGLWVFSVKYAPKMNMLYYSISTQKPTKYTKSTFTLQIIWYRRI